MNLPYEIKPLPDGTFDVCDKNGVSPLGTFSTRQYAESAQRMLNLFETVNAQIKEFNNELRKSLKEAQS